MGHGCEAVMIASVLADLTRANNWTTWPALATQLWRLAMRISDNRVVAGVHFPVDSLGSVALARWAAQYFKMVAAGTGHWSTSKHAFVPLAGTVNPDQNVLISDSLVGVREGDDLVFSVPKSQELSLLWQVAANELAYI